MRLTQIRKTYSFDDVMLVPRLSKLDTRAAANLATTVAGIKLRIPIIAANMSSVCEVEMAKVIADLGGLGIIHRMCSVRDQWDMILQVRHYSNIQKDEDVRDGCTPHDLNVGFSIGIGPDWTERMDLCSKDANIACLDIAHGHHERVFKLLDVYFEKYKNYPLIIGQVSTAEAVLDLMGHIPAEFAGSVAFKASIGGGSLCTTRIKTGFGIPTLQAVMDIAGRFPTLSLIADGGIKESGDIVKSLAAGADAVMLGNLLAGTDEAPGRLIKGRDDQLYKVYRGSASFGDKSLRGEETRNVEGEETLVSYKGPVERVIANLLDGIRSGFSYGGASNIPELQDDIEFIEITSAGLRESLAHVK